MSTDTDTIEETEATGEDFSIPTHMKCNTCDFVKPNGDPSPCPEGHVSGFTRADDEEQEIKQTFAEIDEQEQAEAEAEPEDVEDEDRRLALKIALDEMSAAQDRLDKDIEDFGQKKRASDNAKKKAEASQDDLNAACRRVREARDGARPDPVRYPLYDQAKREINGLFPAPEAIQPLPPDTFAEALRRKQRDTPLLSMGFKASTLKVLGEKHGLKTALDLVNKVSEYGRRNMDLTKMDGITELRFAEVADKLEELTGECEAAWKAEHPDEEIPTVEDEAASDEEGGDE